MNKDNHLSTPSELTANKVPSSTSTKLASNALPEDLSKIVAEINAIADRDCADPIALLVLLRTLEQLHREIQEGYFQSALPNSRQSLYALLRDIEENGGWPYIQRWKLQALFANLSEPEP